MPNSSFVHTAKPKVTGGVAVGPAGTTVPTDATTALDAALKGQGYVGPNGLQATQDRSSEKFRAWGGKLVHVAQTEYGESFTFTLIESSNGDVLKTVYGDGNVTVGAAAGDPTVIRHNEAEPPEAVWVFDMMTGLKGRRIVLPKGKLSSIGDITYSDSELIAYELTVDALPDDSGVSAYEYIGTAA